MPEAKRNISINKVKQNLKIESIHAEAEIALLKLLSRRQDHFQNNESNNSNQIRFVWAEKGKLYELVDILFRMKFIKSKNDFFSLFEKPELTTMVKWNPAKKYHLAYLLYRLYEEKHFVMIGNKGYFKYAEDHFTDFKGTPIKKNALKNIKLKILNNKDDYAFICSEMDQIIARITE
jgi:hypothetical protein